ncbi:MAG TPA: GNAT family N-acetyltransferase [Anaerolineales bacterium]|nr:GNAT family N-acetyltransferase [Anaerolineales bacterium]
MIDQVCAEGRWLETPHYIPTPAWEHALESAGNCLPVSPYTACAPVAQNFGVCPGHLLLVVCKGAEVTGWCRVFPEKISEGEGQLSLEIGLGLLPAYRNQGIGTRLVALAVEWARWRNCAVLEAWTRPDNRSAQRVLAKNGFDFWSAPPKALRASPGLPNPPFGNLRLGKRIH